MNFAHLASFQAIEFVDRPISTMLAIFVCQTSENKAFLTLQNAAFVKNGNTIESHPQPPRFLLGPPGTITTIFLP